MHVVSCRRPNESRSVPVFDQRAVWSADDDFRMAAVFVASFDRVL
jgi:hypothetical protein